MNTRPFQCIKDQILDRCDGAIWITDDIISMVKMAQNISNVWTMYANCLCLWFGAKHCEECSKNLFCHIFLDVSAMYKVFILTLTRSAHAHYDPTKVCLTAPGFLGDGHIHVNHHSITLD